MANLLIIVERLKLKFSRSALFETNAKAYLLYFGQDCRHWVYFCLLSKAPSFCKSTVKVRNDKFFIRVSNSV